MGSFLTSPANRAGKACNDVEASGGTIRINGTVANGQDAFLAAIECMDPQSLGWITAKLEDLQRRVADYHNPMLYKPALYKGGHVVVNIKMSGECMIDEYDFWDEKWH